MNKDFYRKFAEKKLNKGWTIEQVCSSLYGFLDKRNNRRAYIVEYFGKIDGQWIYKEEIIYLERVGDL